MSLRFSSPLSQLALGPTCHLPIPTYDHVSSKQRKICSTCCAEYIILRTKMEQKRTWWPPAAPCSAPSLLQAGSSRWCGSRPARSCQPGDIPNQRDTTIHWHYNNVVDLKIRCEHSPHLRRQILCSRILFSSQSQATPYKGLVSLNVWLKIKQTFWSMLVTVPYWLK